eukprot:TRINITY_DN24645_c0_g1_i1.p1 TRINITY_DN24645_c0_g1~~TRINITY_DN24645_c0_g1_i1.p1  ORF type:complete len:1216 (+),score=330.50 TRINITY_DN24645_c0_g1_i1:46-3648(+)
MAYNYVSTLHKPTVVRFCSAGSLVAPGARNLVVGYATRLVLYDVTAEGLAPLFDEALFGSLVMAEVFRPKRDTVDYLFLAFENDTCCVAKWDAAAGRMVMISTQSLAEPLLRHPDAGKYINAAIDPTHTLVVFNLFMGQLKVVKIKPDGTLAAPYKVRLEQPKVTDMCFVDRDVFGTKGHPTLVVLYPGPQELGEVRVYYLPLSEQVILATDFRQENLEAGALKVTRAPGGVLVYGEQLIAHLSAIPSSKHMSSTTIRIGDYSTSEERERPEGELAGPTALCAWCHVDDKSLLLSSEEGKVYGLTVRPSPKGQAPGVSLRLEALGLTARACCLAWLGGSERLLYLGSDSGDSMLVQMLEHRADDGSWIEVSDVFPSLGPMTGFILSGNTAGSDHMVACCGAGKDGSLRVVRNGIGISELAAVDVGGVQDMWTLCPHGSDRERFVVLSFVGGLTRVLEVRSDELAETEINAFDTNSATLWSGNVRFDAAECGVSASEFWVQVTPQCVRLADRRTRDLHATYVPDDSRITLGTTSGSKIVIACGARLISLVLRGHELVPVMQVVLDEQVSCFSLISVAPGARSPTSHAPMISPATHIAVGLWNSENMHVLDAQDLSIIATAPLGVDALARSFQFLRTEGHDALLCGLGDGSLIVWRLTTNARAMQLSARKRIQLGTQPVRLQLIETVTQQSSRGPATKQAVVFACSDKPAIVSMSNGRLEISPVNVKAVSVVCPFNSPFVGDGHYLVYSSENKMVIGSVDGMQKLHVRGIPLHNEPTSVTLHEASQNYIVTLLTEDPGALNTVTVVSGCTYEPVSHFSLDPDEMAMCCHCIKFAGDAAEYIAVGTVYMDPREELPRNGRVLVFALTDNQPTLMLVTEHAAMGNVTKLASLQGKLLAGVNSAMHLFKWEESVDGRVLTMECSHRCHLNIISMDVEGDRIAVGDIFRSLSVVQYKAEDSTFVDISHDGIPRRVTASYVAGGEYYAVAEDMKNLVILHHERDPDSDTDSKRLVRSGYIHLGCMVNAFAKGSLTRAPALQQPSPTGDVPMDNDGGDDDAQPTEALCFADPASPLLLNTRRSWVFGTTEGSIGTVTALSYSQFVFLDLLQGAAAAVLTAIGDASHANWRAFRYEEGYRQSMPEPSKHIVDGDLIEAVVQASEHVQEAVLAAFNKALAARAKDVEFDGFSPISMPALADILNNIVSPH